MKLISYLVRTFIALVLIGTLATCVPEYDDPSIGFGDGQLSVSATVSDAVVVTKAQSVEALNEKQLNTLDVFVEHVTNGVGDGTFLKQYHLVTNDNAGNPISEAKNFLAARWRQEGLQSGQYYNIYVAVNNTKTKVEIASVAALKALTYSEVEEGIAVVDATSNNISWPTTDQFAKTPSGFIYKQYVSESGADAVKINGNLYGFTTEKEFMMDAVLKNWTPVSGSKDQVFGGDSNGSVTLNRAAAKFVLNVKFDADFLKSLTHKKDGDTWVEKPAAEKVTITGAPAWRFYNFAFGAPVFAPETQGAGVEVHSSETLLRHPYPYEGEDKHFQIITYSYPNAWDANDYSTAAPSLVISVGYTENNVTNYHYYRIPLVKSTVTKIERNHIYVINATIATRGSATQEDVTLTEDIQYAVLHWNDKNNSEAVQNNVESAQYYYLKVNPKIYTLRGDGDQSVVIKYLKASGSQVKWQLYTFNTATQAKGSPVASTNSNAVWGWYYDDEGTMKTSYSGMNHMGVTIAQSGEGLNNTNGTITVTSTALPNRAIKFMLLRIYLDEVQSLYEDVIIRHFPTDNIQNIKSLWSSRTTENWWDPSSLTGNWWNTTNVYGYGIGYDGRFRARYYYNNSYMRGANNQSASNYHDWQNQTSLTNNKKYVIQISSTSSEYVLGRPLLDDNNQSNDHVVSPAFIIASQLGATTSTSPRNNQIATYAREAANHCKTYKEVDADGTAWTGWRLPTREEVGVIIRYQHAHYDTMDPVLTGRYYWTLEGAAVATGINNEDNETWYSDWATRYSNSSYDYQSGRGNCYIRCIRDMSASEINELNDFETIVQQYRESNSN